MALVAKDGVDIDIDTLGEFVDTVILEPLSRIPGISEVTSREAPNGRFVSRLIWIKLQISAYRLQNCRRYQGIIS